MSETRSRPLPVELQAWGQEFVAVIERQPAKRRIPFLRGLFAGVAVLVVTAGVAAAATGGFDFDPDSTEIPVSKTGRTLGYMNLETNEPITCPDGEMLTLTITAETGPREGPTCADGSVPEVFWQQVEAMKQWMARAQFGDALKDGPNFSFVLSDEPPGE
jgi:hypothetical protein